MKRIAMMTLIVVFSLVSISAQIAEVKTYLKTSYMNWREHSPSQPDPWLEENSGIYSIGANIIFSPIGNFFGQIGGEVFGGQINYSYNGNDFVGTDDKSLAPFKTTTGRLGATLEATAGYKMGIGKDIYLSPFITPGFSAWWRIIGTGEIWITAYGKLGASIEAGNFFVRSGFFVPLFTQNNCFWQGFSWLNDGRLTDVVMYPKGIPTPFIEAGIRFTGFNISISYEPKEWGKSDDLFFGKAWNVYRVFQPRTTYDSVGISIDWPQR